LFPQIFYNVENSKNKETLELVSVNFWLVLYICPIERWPAIC
jgi:hypothetical protein